jgi:hypothetical protein
VAEGIGGLTDGSDRFAMTEELVIEGYCRRMGGDRVARGSRTSDQPGNAGLTSMPALGCTATFNCAEPRSQAPFASRSQLPSFQFAQPFAKAMPHVSGEACCNRTGVLSSLSLIGNRTSKPYSGANVKEL